MARKGMSVQTKSRYYKYLSRMHGAQCFYCGVMTLRTHLKVPHRMTLDHVTPISHGGPNLIWNLVICCDKCNGDRGNMLFDDYIAKTLKNADSLTRRNFYQRHASYSFLVNLCQNTDHKKVERIADLFMSTYVLTDERELVAA